MSRGFNIKRWSCHEWSVVVRFCFFNPSDGSNPTYPTPGVHLTEDINSSRGYMRILPKCTLRSSEENKTKKRPCKTFLDGFCMAGWIDSQGGVGANVFDEQSKQSLVMVEVFPSSEIDEVHEQLLGGLSTS